MAYEIPGFKLTLPAGSSLASDKNKLVVLATDGQIDVATGAHTARPVGVLQNSPTAAGEAATIMVTGVVKCIVGEIVTAGALVCPSSGTAGSVDLADATGDVIIGIALSAGAIGDVIPVLLFGGAGGYKA